MEYGANPDMVEVLYREMISRFISMEMEKIKKKQSSFKNFFKKDKFAEVQNN